MDAEIKIGVAVLLIGVLALMAADTVGAVYYGGIPRTHKGSIIYVDHRYNKWCGYRWTDVEVLTYSGDTHHVQFWDHVNFDLDKTYEIHTIREYKLFLNNGWVCYERVVELIDLS